MTSLAPPPPVVGAPPAPSVDVVSASAAAYSRAADAYAREHADAVAETAAWFAGALLPGAAVLDAGCGPGRDLARFTDAGLSPVGVDLNPVIAQMASRHARALVGDLRRLPFADETFHGVWACASLVHLPPAAARRALDEFLRVTRPGGLVYASVMHVGENGWQNTPDGALQYFHIWHPLGFESAVLGAGLIVDRVERGEVFVDVWAHRPLDPMPRRPGASRNLR